MKNLRKLRLEDNPGLKDDHSKEYVKFMEIIEGKTVGIQPRAKALKRRMMDALSIDRL